MICIKDPDRDPNPSTCAPLVTHTHTHTHTHTKALRRRQIPERKPHFKNSDSRCKTQKLPFKDKIKIIKKQFI